MRAEEIRFVFSGSSGRRYGKKGRKGSNLDGMVELVAGEAGHVEEHFAQRVGHPRFGTFETSDKGFVAFAG